MNILEKIVALKKKSLKVSKEKIPLKKLIVEKNHLLLETQSLCLMSFLLLRK